MHARGHRLGDARRRLGAGGPRLRAGRPRGHAPGPRAVPPLLRRLPHLARDQQDRAPRRRRHAGARPRRGRPGLPRPRPDARRAGRARHRPEPGRRSSRPARRRTRYYLAVPGIVQEVMDELAERTGRRYGLVDYHGAPDADRVVVVMGSAAGAVEETVDALNAAGAEGRRARRSASSSRSPSTQLVAALPATVRAIAVLDRTKEPGAVGEPLYQAVVAAIAERMDADEPPFATMPRVIGGRYGLSSKEVTPGDDQAGLRRARRPAGRSATSRSASTTTSRTSACRSTPSSGTPRPAGEVQALFFGLGSDGTVGANKASVKIIGEGTDLFAQGYFVYDSKKSGSAHRLAPAVRTRADPVGLPDRRGRLRRLPPVRAAREDRTSSSSRSPAPRSSSTRRTGPTRSGTTCLATVQQQLIDKQIDLWVIDAFAVADRGRAWATASTR